MLTDFEVLLHSYTLFLIIATFFFQLLIPFVPNLQDSTLKSSESR